MASDIRASPLSSPAGTLWLTGLPGAGKTTIAHRALSELRGSGRPACVLDGDLLREGLSSDLGFSRADRGEQARRAAHVATMFSEAGVVAIVALVSPYAEDRAMARQIHARLSLPFFEVWVATPQEICQQRDRRGLYAQARRGEISGLTGVDAPYEEPQAPDLRIHSQAEDPGGLAQRLIELLPARPSPEP
jgi:bifunctional enzyme CysN/CysC